MFILCFFSLNHLHVVSLFSALSAICCVKGTLFVKYLLLVLINKTINPADILWLFSASRGVIFLANCTCNIIPIKNTQVFYFGCEGPRDQCVSLLYTKYKDEAGVSEVV